MPTGTKRGYALVLGSTTLVAVAAALLICWAAGTFQAPLGLAAWVAIIVLLGLGWMVGGMLVSFLFLGARSERNASLAEALSARRLALARRRTASPPRRQP